MIFNEYYIVLDRFQKLNLEEAKLILKEFSNTYRKVNFKENEIFEMYSDIGLYFFIQDNNIDKINKINFELNKRGISSKVMNNASITELRRQMNMVVRCGIAYSIKFNQVEYPITFDPLIWQENKTVFADKETSNGNKSHKLNLSHDKLDKFEEFFSNKIIGQDHVLEKIKEQLILISYETNNNKTRPAGIFFFAGPTGVGKTEVCKSLSQFLYDNSNINRFDMSEYKSEGAIQKLIGAPSGYVGYESGGTLINAMNKNPNAIVLFDEIEKADKSVFDLFLQILDEGLVTSNKGEKISFKNNIIIFTSNLGANLIRKDTSQEEAALKIKEKIEYFFVYELNRSEILGRIGKENIISFNLINKEEDLFKIVDINFNKFIEEMKTLKINLIFDKRNVYLNILKDVDVTKGARDIRNEFEQFKKHFVKALYENKLSYLDLQNKTISFDYDNEKVILKEWK